MANMQTGHIRDMEQIETLSEKLKKSWEEVDLTQPDVERINEFADEVDHIGTKYDYIGIEARKLAIRICQFTDKKRHKETALTKLEEVIYWAEEGITNP